MSKMAAFNFDEDIFWKFKDKCHKEGTTMTERIMILVRNYLAVPKSEFADEIQKIEDGLLYMDLEKIKVTNDRVKELYSQISEPNMKHRIEIIATRLKERYKTLNEQKAFSNSTAV